MENAKPKLPATASGKSRGHIEDIGIDFLQPQQYYWDAVKNRSINPKDFNTLMPGKSRPLPSKNVQPPNTNTVPSLGDSSNKCIDHHVDAQGKLPSNAMQSSREDFKNNNDSLTQKMLKKTAKILKDHLVKPSILTKVASVQENSKKRKPESKDDSLEHSWSRTSRLISETDFGSASKRKKGTSGDSSASESVGSDSSSYDNAKIPNATETSHSRKKLSRRRERDKSHQLSNHLKRKSSVSHKSHNSKLAKRRHQQNPYSDPEYIFRKYWICAQAVNDPKLRMKTTVILIRMTPEFIESYCRHKDPDPFVSWETADVSKERRQMSSSCAESDILTETRPAISDAIKLLQSDKSEQSDDWLKNASLTYPGSDKDKLPVRNVTLKLQISTSDSDNAKAPQAVFKRKRRRRIKKTSTVFTSAKAAYKTTASTSERSEQKLHRKSKNSDSEDELLFSPRKVRSVSTSSVLIPSSASVPESIRPATAGSETPKPSNCTVDSSLSDNSAVEELKASDDFPLCQAPPKMSASSSSRLVNCVLPAFIRLPRTDDELKEMGINTRVCVRLVRIILPFSGNEQYPNVFCHYVKPLCRDKHDTTDSISSQKQWKKLSKNSVACKGIAKECDTTGHKKKRQVGPTRLKNVTDQATKKCWTPRINFKPICNLSRSNSRRTPKSRVLVSTSSEDSESEPCAADLSEQCTSKTTHSDMDQTCVAPMNEAAERMEDNASIIPRISTVKVIKCNDTTVASHDSLCDSLEKEKENIKLNRTGISTGVVSSKSPSRMKDVTKHKSGKRDSGKGERRKESPSRFSSSTSKRGHSAEEMTKRKHGATKHSSREHCSRRDHQGHDRSLNTSSDRYHSRTKSRSRRDYERSGTVKTSHSSEKNKFLTVKNADCSDGVCASTEDIERAYDSLCSIPTDVDDHCDKAEQESFVEDICEKYFLLNGSSSGCSPEPAEDPELETVEEYLGKKTIEDYLGIKTHEDTCKQKSRKDNCEQKAPIENLVNDARCETDERNLNIYQNSEDNLEMETLKTDDTNDALSKTSNSMSLDSKPPEKEEHGLKQQDIQYPSTLSDSSEVYDPLDDFEPNFERDFCDPLIIDPTSNASPVSSTYTAPSPTSTAPSPTFDELSPDYVAPSPVSSTRDNTSWPSDHSVVSVYSPTSLFTEHEKRKTMGSFSVLDMDTTSRSECHNQKDDLELPDYSDEQNSKNFCNLDMISIAVNRSHAGVDNGSDIDWDALSLLAPSLTLDSVFGVTEFEDNVPSKEHNTITDMQSPDDDERKLNENVILSHHQPTAIVRPLSFQEPSITFNERDNVPVNFDCDQRIEKEKGTQEFTGRHVSELLDQLTTEIEENNIKTAVHLFQFLETKMVGILKWKLLDCLLSKTSSEGILSPCVLGEVVKIVNKTVPSCDNLEKQVLILRKCLKTILICKRTTSLKLLSLELMGIHSNSGLTKFYNNVLLNAINADASEVLHLYKEGLKVGIQLDVLVVRALSEMFQASNLHSLAKDIYELGCLMGVYSIILVSDWPVCLKLRSYYTENEIETIFKDFIDKIVVQFNGEFFTDRPKNLTEKEKYTIYLSIEDFEDNQGRNIRFLKDANPSLEAVHKRICNVLHMHKITHFNTSMDGRLMEIDWNWISYLLSRTDSKDFPRPLFSEKPVYLLSSFKEVLSKDFEANPL